LVKAPLPLVKAPLPLVKAPLPLVKAPLPLVKAPLPLVKEKVVFFYSLELCSIFVFLSSHQIQINQGK